MSQSLFGRAVSRHVLIECVRAGYQCAYACFPFPNNLFLAITTYQRAALARGRQGGSKSFSEPIPATTTNVAAAPTTTFLASSRFSSFSAKRANYSNKTYQGAALARGKQGSGERFPGPIPATTTKIAAATATFPPCSMRRSSSVLLCVLTFAHLPPSTKQTVNTRGQPMREPSKVAKDLEAYPSSNNNSNDSNDSNHGPRRSVLWSGRRKRRRRMRRHGAGDVPTRRSGGWNTSKA